MEGLSPYALASVFDTKKGAHIGEGSEKDGLIESIVNEVSDLIRSEWGRDLVTRATDAAPTLTQYYPRPGQRFLPLPGDGPYPGSELWPNEYPIIAVTDVYEDSALEFAVSTKLVAGTDYRVVRGSAHSGPWKIVRISGGYPIAWSCTPRSVRVRGSYGYQTNKGQPEAAQPVPDGVLRVFYDVVGWAYRQRVRGEVGLSQINDATGQRVFGGPAFLMPAQKAALMLEGASGPASLRLVMGEEDAA